MQALLLVAVAMQVKMGVHVTRDSADTAQKRTEVSLGIRTGSSDGERRREPKRIPVTAEHRRTAFKSANYDATKNTLLWRPGRNTVGCARSCGVGANLLSLPTLPTLINRAKLF